MVTVRAAQPGDICVLLMPDVEDLPTIRREQESLVAAFGGWKSPEVHVTCQRFEPSSARSVEEVLLRLRAGLGRMSQFPIQASRLIQFEAPFWQTYVLRWEVQLTPAFTQFVQNLDTALVDAGITPHYPHDTPFTCSAVDLVKPVQLELAPPVRYPITLFQARRVVFSRVLGLNDFETIGYASLKEEE